MLGWGRWRLDDNNIGDEGVMALAHNLPNGLEDLQLEGNDIGDEGAKALAYKLPELAKLKTLSLYNNEIGDNVTSGGKEILMSAWLGAGKDGQTLFLGGSNQ